MAWRRLVTASDDGLAKVWVFSDDDIILTGVLGTGSAEYGVKDPKHNKLFKETDKWRGHTAPITSVAWAPGEEQILTTSRDCKAKVWYRMSKPSPDSAEGTNTFWMRKQTLPPPARVEEKIVVEGPQKKPFLRVIEHKYRSLGARAAEAVKEHQPIDSGHAGSVYMGMVGTMNLDNDRLKKSDWVATCSHDKTVIIWNVITGRRHMTLRSVENGHTGPVTMVSTNRGEIGRPFVMMTSSYDRTIKIWDLKTGFLAKTISENHQSDSGGTFEGPHNGAIWSAYFSIDDAQRHILSASQDGFVKVWDVASGKCINSFPGKRSQVLHAKWHPEIPYLFVAWRLDGQIMEYDIRTPQKETKRFRHHQQCVWSVEYAHNGANQLLTSSHDTTASIVDLRVSQDTAPVAFTGTTPRCGTGPGVVSTLEGHTGLLWKASWSQDNAYVVTCSEDRTAQVFKVSGGGPRIFGRILTEKPPEERTTTTAVAPIPGALYNSTHRLAVTHVAWDAWDGTGRDESGREKMLAGRQREELECFDTRVS